MKPDVKPPEELKPERIQDRILGDGFGTFINNLSGAVEWIEAVAEQLRQVIGVTRGNRS